MYVSCLCCVSLQLSVFLFSPVCFSHTTEVSTMLACPSCMCLFFISFLNRGNAERTNFSKKLCLVFVYVSFV